MSLSITTSNELIENLIGYDPDKLCLEIIRRADLRCNIKEKKYSINIKRELNIEGK